MPMKHVDTVGNHDPVWSCVLQTTGEVAGENWEPLPRLLDRSWKEDTSLFLILCVFGVGCVIALLPQFEWFRSLTGIEGWIPFIDSLFR
jgi:hypothetical protein